jgi:hypothetical protein
VNVSVTERQAVKLGTHTLMHVHLWMPAMKFYDDINQNVTAS